MRIMAPCSRPDEVETLIRMGADELYCGVFDEAWARQWGLASSPNRRGPGPGNLGSFEELVQVCREAAPAGVPVYVVLNAPYHEPAQEEAVGRFAAAAACEAGVHGLILGHPGLVRRLARELPEVALVTSNLCTARNVQAVRFLAAAGAHRVILSRQLSLVEIRYIRDSVPEVELEVFVLDDDCAFEEGCCSSAHALPGFDQIYCLTPWARSPSTPALDNAFEVLDVRRQAIAQRGFTQHGRLPLGPCGLCAIPDLLEMGIDSVKIVGREAHPYRKVRSVQMVRHVLNRARRDGGDRARKRAVEMREDEESCRRGLSCYYPEVRPRGTGSV